MWIGDKIPAWTPPPFRRGDSTPPPSLPLIRNRKIGPFKREYIIIYNNNNIYIYIYILLLYYIFVQMVVSIRFF